MFGNQEKRYMTKGVANSLHPEIQQILWRLLDNRVVKGEVLDFLQVFELTVKDQQQYILHRQEQPSFKQQLIVQLQNTEPIISTIWCMDNGETQVVMYPEDY